jgi:hypothetical protein
MFFGSPDLAEDHLEDASVNEVFDLGRRRNPQCHVEFHPSAAQSERGNPDGFARRDPGGEAGHEGTEAHCETGRKFTGAVLWDNENTVAISVENKQLLSRVPPGPGEGGGGVAEVLGGFPLTLG